MISRFCVFFLVIFLLAGSVTVWGSPSSVNIVVFEQSDRTFLIPDAMIYIDGQFGAKTDANGTYNLSYTGAPPVLKVTKAGYSEWTGTPSVNDTAVLVPLQVRNCTYNVHILDSDTLLPVSDVVITVSPGQNGKDEYKTGSNGSVTMYLRTEQAYDLDISSKGYQPTHDTIVTGFENKDVQYSISRNDRISVMITDADDKRVISDALIIMDGKNSGKTNDKGILTTNLTRDEDHTLEVSAPGYEKIKSNKTVGANDLILEIELKRQHSTIFVSVFDSDKKPVPGASIDVDGKNIGETNQYGRITIPDLELKEYAISSSKDGYEKSSKKVAVSEGTNDIVLDLNPQKKPVLVEVRDSQNKSVSNASVTVDGVISGTTGISGDISINLQNGRNYTFQAEKTGYHPVNNTTPVRISGDTSVLIKLEKDMQSGPDLFVWGIVGIIAIIVIIILVRVGGNRSSGKQKRRSLRKRSL